MPNEEHFSKAHQVFLDQNPRIKQKLDTLDPKIGEAIGITIDEYRDKELKEEFRRYARLNGLSIHDLVIELVCETPEEKRELRLQARLEVEKALGIK